MVVGVYKQGSDKLCNDIGYDECRWMEVSEKWIRVIVVTSESEVITTIFPGESRCHTTLIT